MSWSVGRSLTPLVTVRVIVYRISSRPFKRVVFLIAMLACPWSVALQAGETLLTRGTSRVTSVTVALTLKGSVPETTIKPAVAPGSVQELSLYSLDLEERDETGDLEVSACDFSTLVFASALGHSPPTPSVSSPWPRSSKIRPFVRLRRFLC